MFYKMTQEQRKLNEERSFDGEQSILDFIKFNFIYSRIIFLSVFIHIYV